MNKKAFTLPEILMIIVVIAIVAVTMMTTLRPGANQHVLKKLYYNAYRSLNAGAFNIQADVEDHNNKLMEEADATGTEMPTEDELKKYPETQADLCEKLASADKGYLNVSLAPACGNVVDATSLTQFTDKKPEELKAMATFITSNGMLYFMSPMDANGNTIVWVDLNGERKPNSAEWKKDNPADIVPFLISNNGIVVPLGYPTFDTRYLTTRVSYSNPDIVKDSKLMSFRSAKFAAFSDKAYSLDPLSIADPIVLTNADIQTMIAAPVADSDCPSRGTEEFPACSVKVESQDKMFINND